MSKKHPGRDTETAKWMSRLAKLDNEMKAERERLKKETGKDGTHKGHKRKKREEEE